MEQLKYIEYGFYIVKIKNFYRLIIHNDIIFRKYEYFLTNSIKTDPFLKIKPYFNINTNDTCIIQQNINIILRELKINKIYGKL
jgi:hypothetical protein